MLHLRPHAKVNLGLFIQGKRADGYHLLETLLYPVRDHCDDLWLEPRQDDRCVLTIEGLALDSTPADNLCVRAWEALRRALPDLPGVTLHLRKQIPAGAGLGGGSSDAAFTLRGLNQLYALGLDTAQLAHIATPLGADVPFFLYDQPLLARGIGTDFEPLDLDLPYTLRVFPQPIHSSTVAAYRALDYRQCPVGRDLRAVLAQPVATWRTDLVNDLEGPVFAMYPALATAKAALYEQGAIYAAMSGSGSALLGLFAD
ncbi:MAG: 4-(cytidine 5'-diphospho)-2-C-methyl-D-erythritol kinase [Bacteroidia bacterium]